jgi:LmbE family N-acetylglucosaminyl deacetylase
MLNIYRKIFLAAVFFLYAPLASWAVDAPAIGVLDLSPKDRILILAPHPDDEVLGTGGVIQRSVAMGLPVKVVFFTYGDSNQWSFLLYRKHPVFMPGAVQKMGLIRRDEAMSASGVLGLSPGQLTFLGYPDFGTMNIWFSHWGSRPPLRSFMTRVNAVPYQGAFRPGALYKGEEIVADLRAILREFKPTKIFISHPADHNGDHLSLYLYTRVALWDEKMDSRTELFPYLVHYIGWPKPKGFVPNDQVPPETLRSSVLWTEYRLTPQEFAVKKRALQAHRSQYTSSPKYLLSFVKNNELFGDFPSVRLHVNEDSSVFSGRRKTISEAELPEEFNSQEKTAFVGVEWKFVRWEGSDLIISIQLSKPLAQDVEASVYIFGYSPATPFGQMPKINVRLGGLSYTVYDQSKRIAQDSISVKRTPSDVTIAVPLKLLGNPDRILTSARTYLGNVPLDSASWVSVELY